MSASPLRFRCWDTKARRFITEVPPEEYMLDCDEWGHPDDMASMFYPAHPLRTFGCRLVYDRWTGLIDRTGRDIYEGDLLVTENDHAKGGDPEYDNWTAEDMGTATVSIDGQWGVRIAHCSNVWSWDDEDSVYHLRFLRVVGNVHEKWTLAMGGKATA